jgi:site-specific recombinase XerD
MSTTLARRAPWQMPNLPTLRRRVGALPPVEPPRPPCTLAEHVPAFLVWIATVRGRVENTVLSYGRDLACFTAFARARGIEDPRGVTHGLIEGYLAGLQVKGGRTPNTAARRLHCLRTFFKYLVREGAVERDVAAVSFGPKTAKPLPRYLTIPEQERVLSTLAEDRSLLGRRDHAIVATLLFTGLRVNELIRLARPALDLEVGTLRVVHGKGGKDREVPVVPRLAAILRAYLADVRPSLPGAGTDPWVFLRAPAASRDARAPNLTGTVPWSRARAGEPIERRVVWWMLQKRVAPVVGHPVHPHMLRHSFASRLRAAGVDLQLISEVLGHTDIRTTTIYAHLATPQQRATVARAMDPAPPTAGRGEEE